jgi:hypothetical protein
MEILLNLVWLALAFTSALVWATHWRKFMFVRSRRAEVIRSAVGLMCVLLFMFYAISLSDDLYEMTALVEDAPALRLRSSGVANPDNHVPRPTPVAIATVTTGNAVPELVALDTVSMFVVPSFYSRSSRPASLRAPPLVCS